MMPLVLFVATYGFAVPLDDPSLKELFSASEKTAARLEKERASWVSRQEYSGNLIVEVGVDRTRQGDRFEVYGLIGKRREKFATLIVSNGLWYVGERDSRAKYRPFESPFVVPTTVLFLTRTD